MCVVQLFTQGKHANSSELTTDVFLGGAKIFPKRNKKWLWVFY